MSKAMRLPDKVAMNVLLNEYNGHLTNFWAHNDKLRKVTEDQKEEFKRRLENGEFR